MKAHTQSLVIFPRENENKHRVLQQKKKRKLIAHEIYESARVMQTYFLDLNRKIEKKQTGEQKRRKKNWRGEKRIGVKKKLGRRKI